MDFANRGSRPTQQMTQQPTQSVGSNLPSGKNNKGLDFGKVSAVTLLFAGTLLAGAAIVSLILADGNNNSSSATISSEQALVSSDKYQAVFLNSQDGQVYFGKLTVLSEDWYKLTDIYYVRVEQPIQPEGANQSQQPNISLAKLGNELHGPEDTMYIARDKVLYWENLKNDGQVVTAINEFKKNGEKAPEEQTQQNGAGAGGGAGTNQTQLNNGR